MRLQEERERTAEARRAMLPQDRTPSTTRATYCAASFELCGRAQRAEFETAKTMDAAVREGMGGMHAGAFSRTLAELTALVAATKGEEAAATTAAPASARGSETDRHAQSRPPGWSWLM